MRNVNSLGRRAEGKSSMTHHSRHCLLKAVVDLLPAMKDLVRAHEDACSDLMRVRRRLSKLPLRHGRIYSQGQAWTGVHEVWLRR
jgi:hypothetical protein